MTPWAIQNYIWATCVEAPGLDEYRLLNCESPASGGAGAGQFLTGRRPSRSRRAAPKLAVRNTGIENSWGDSASTHSRNWIEESSIRDHESQSVHARTRGEHECFRSVMSHVRDQNLVKPAGLTFAIVRSGAFIGIQGDWTPAQNRPETRRSMQSSPPPPPPIPNSTGFPGRLEILVRLGVFIGIQVANWNAERADRVEAGNVLERPRNRSSKCTWSAPTAAWSDIGTRWPRNRPADPGRREPGSSMKTRLHTDYRDRHCPGTTAGSVDDLRRELVLQRSAGIALGMRA